MKNKKMGILFIIIGLMMMSQFIVSPAMGIARIAHIDSPLDGTHVIPNVYVNFVARDVSLSDSYYKWNINGQIITGRSINYKFIYTGTYVVLLYVTWSGTTTSDSVTIYVDPYSPPPPPPEPPTPPPVSRSIYASNVVTLMDSNGDYYIVSATIWAYYMVHFKPSGAIDHFSVYKIRIIVVVTTDINTCSAGPIYVHFYHKGGYKFWQAPGTEYNNLDKSYTVDFNLNYPACFRAEVHLILDLRQMKGVLWADSGRL